PVGRTAAASKDGSHRPSGTERRRGGDDGERPGRPVPDDGRGDRRVDAVAAGRPQHDRGRNVDVDERAESGGDESAGRGVEHARSAGGGRSGPGGYYRTGP